MPAAVLAAVAPAAVPAAVLAVAPAGAGSMTHKVRGEGWVQQVSKVLKVVEVVVAAVAGDECENAWFDTMSCASGRIVAADLVHGFFARLGMVAAKTAGRS